MQTKLFNVTPKWAAAQLEEHDKRLVAGTFRQRKIRASAVKRYAEDMRAGAWRVTHQGIAFDTEGNILDGQHRLLAVVKANVPVQMQVTTNLPAEGVMDSIDCGAARSVANQLQIVHGYANAFLTAAIIRNIAVLALTDGKRPYSDQVPATTATAVWMLETLGFAESIERGCAVVTTTKLRVGYWMGPWALYHRTHPQKAEDFARSLVLLEDLRAGHPALMLHRYIAGRAERPRSKVLQTMRVVAGCLQAFHEGKTMDVTFVRGSKEAHSWLLQCDGGKLSDQIYKRMVVHGIGTNGTANIPVPAKKRK